MCEFCTKHGEGEKWYLRAKSYSEDLALQRRNQIKRVFEYFDDGLARDLDRVENLIPKLPRPVRHILSSYLTRHMKKEHFGQVVPIEDIETIFGMVNSIVRVPCVCRRVTVGREVRYCLGVSMSPDGGVMFGVAGSSLQQGPDTDGLEKLTAAEALEFMRGVEKDGLVHSVWTFGTPFIGGICNCDRADCIAMRATIGAGVKAMFKAEYVASVDWEKCTGCRQCLRQCQFGAMGFSAARKRAYIDSLRCYGCGVCRAACSTGAIELKDRGAVPAAARSW